MEKGGSRLMQMQAKFQQRQMQEREMKIANLYETQQARALDRVRQSPSNGVRQTPNGPNGNGAMSNGNGAMSNGSVRSNGSVNSPPQTVTHQPGKVRQMFEERRTKAGIDKSYPLQPIHNTERTRKPLPNGYPKVAATSHSTSRVTEKRTTKTNIISQKNGVVRHVTNHKSESIVNGSGDLNHNHEPDHNSLKQTLPQSNGEPPSHDTVDHNENGYMLENETFPEALAPQPTPRSPDPAPTIKPPPRRAAAARTTPPRAKPPPQSPRKVPTAPETGRLKGAMQKSVSPAPSTFKKPPNKPTLQAPGESGSAKFRSSGSTGSASTPVGPACAVCGRHFAQDRLEKHEQICRKAATKKRKPFDVIKHRLAGTEAEPFIGKLRKGAGSTPSTTKVKPLNSSWRQKHAEFIQAIRAAKQVQAHLASGGKLSDLPPPPPSENPDYVSCPHCSRRFNQAAAERHIPKCKNYQFNKPKPSKKR